MIPLRLGLSAVWIICLFSLLGMTAKGETEHANVIVLLSSVGGSALFWWLSLKKVK